MWPRLLALRLDLLAIVEGRNLLLLFTLEDKGPKLRKICTLDFRPGSLSLSASRAHLLLGNAGGSWYEVRDARNGDPMMHVTGPDPFPATFASLDGAEVLVSVARASRLNVIGLPKGDALSQTDVARVGPFVVDNIVSVGDGQSLALIGHPFLDGYRRHLFVTVGELQKGGPLLLDRIKQATSETGSYDIDVGPCGWEDVLVYQGAGRRGAKEDPARLGLTVRRLATGDVLENVAYEAGGAKREGLMGTSLAAAFLSEGGVQLVPRKGLDAEPTFIATRAASFDPESGRVAIATPDCQLQLIDLARS